MICQYLEFAKHYRYYGILDNSCLFGEGVAQLQAGVPASVWAAIEL